MARPLREIEAEALELPADERDELAQKLVESVGEWQSEEIRQAWMEEVRRRDLEIERGEVEMIPGELVMARLRSKFR